MSQNVTEWNQHEANKQERLAELENFFALTLDLWCIADNDGHFLKLNKMWESTLGYSLAELVGQPFLDFVHPDDVQATLRAMSVLDAQNPVLNFINRYRHKDGSYRFIEWHAQPQGKLIYATARDITERKEAVDRLAQLAVIVTSSNDAIITESLDGIISTWNAGAEKMFGYPAGEVVHKSITILFPPEKISEEAALLERIAAGETIKNYETIRLKKDGSQICISVSLSPLKDDQGKTVGASKIAQDITLRKQAEEGLSQLAAIVRSSSDAIYTTSLDGSITSWNKGAETIFGYSADEIMQKSFNVLLMPEQIGEETILLQKIAAGETVNSHERLRLKRDGSQVFVAVSLSPLKDAQGNIVGVSRIAQDITPRKQEEALLRRSESALKKAQRVAHVGSWVWSVQSNKLEWSDEMYRIFGLEKNQFSGDLSEVINTAIHPDDRATVEQANQSVIRDKRPSPLEYRIIWPDGTIRVVWAEAGDMVLDSSGNPGILTGIVQDITERKREEEQLRQSELALKQAQQVAHVGSWTWYVQSNRFEMSDEVFEICGIAREDFSGDLKQLISRIIHPDDRAALVTAGDSPTLNISPDAKEYRIIRPDGERRTLWSEVGDMVSDSAGNPIVLTGIVQDITERKQTEEALRRYAERLAAINRMDRLISSQLELGQIYDGFVKELRALLPLDRTAIGELDEAGDQWKIVRQWTAHQSLFVPGEWHPVQGSLMEWLTTNRVPFFEREVGERGTWPETELLKKEGIRSRCIFPLIIQGRVAGILSVASRQPNVYSEDDQAILGSIADQIAIAMHNAHLYEQIKQHAIELEQRVLQRTAALEKSNQELEAFSYSVSHDLRAPLRAMDGFSRILLDEYAAILPNEAQRYLGLVRENAQQMGNLIDHLLAFSRLNRQSLKKEPVLPATLVRTIVVDLLAAQADRHIDVAIADIPSCQADPVLLRQVFVNLLGNAIKFTKTRAEAKIEVGYLEQDGQPVYFVKDNGVGFDMRYADKLFGVFQRLHRAEDFEGTGVGLATVQRIINRHGGRIWAEAVLDQGAVFYFTLTPEGEQSDGAR